MKSIDTTGVRLMAEDKKRNDLVCEQPMTYDDYVNMPDDGYRYELDDGMLQLMSPSPSSYHKLISFEIQQKLTHDCINNYIIFNAPIDVVLAEKEVKQPDLVLVHRDRLHIITKHGGIEGIPDLVVEILSSSSAKSTHVMKYRNIGLLILRTKFWNSMCWKVSSMPYLKCMQVTIMFNPIISNVCYFP